MNTIAMTRVRRPDGSGQFAVVDIQKIRRLAMYGRRPEVGFHQHHLKESYMRARKADNRAWIYFRFERTPGTLVQVAWKKGPEMVAGARS
jgi:hypothetical protein